MAASTVPMVYQNLGPSGLRVSRLSYGAWVTFNTQLDAKAAYDIMARCFKAGINLFDNAETYSNGAAETVMGEAIKIGEEKKTWERSDLVVTTKIFFGTKDGPNSRGLSRKHIVEGLQASLKRLQLDYVDIVFAHRPDPYTPIEEVVRAFNHIIDRGMAFYWGTSEWSAQDLTEAWRVANLLHLQGPIAEQPQYNIFHRQKVEIDYAPLYRSYGLGLTIWSPLASGILTGKYSGGTIPEGSRFALEGYKWLKDIKLNKQGWQVEKTDLLKPIADELGCSLAQLAVAWCLANPNVSTVLLGATKPEQLEDNLGALAFLPKMTKEVMARIDAIAGTKPEPDQIVQQVTSFRAYPH